MMLESLLATRSWVERVGLDWLPALVGKSVVDEVPPDSLLGLAEIRKKFAPLQTDEELDEAIRYCKDLLEREDSRAGTLESKAFALLGITGIAAAFIIGFAGILLDPTKIDGRALAVAASGMYVLVVASMVCTVFLATKVIAVGPYLYTYPSADAPFSGHGSSYKDSKREHASSLLYSSLKNQAVANTKATYLGGAQLWFRNSVMLLLGLSVLLAVYALFGTGSADDSPRRETPEIEAVLVCGVVPHRSPAGSSGDS